MGKETSPFWLCCDLSSSVLGYIMKSGVDICTYFFYLVAQLLSVGDLQAFMLHAVMKSLT